MKDLVNKYKNWIVVTFVLGAAIIGFLIFSSGSTTAPAVSDRATEAARIEQELLTRLLELRKITLDAAFFEDEVFLSLVDFHQDLLDQPRGREDPFAAIEVTLGQLEQEAFRASNVNNGVGQSSPQGGSVEVSPGPGDSPVAPSPSAAPTVPADDSAAEDDDAAQDTAGNDSSGSGAGPGSAPPPPPPAPGGP